MDSININKMNRTQDINTEPKIESKVMPPVISVPDNAELASLHADTEYFSKTTEEYVEELKDMERCQFQFISAYIQNLRDRGKNYPYKLSGIIDDMDATHMYLSRNGTCMFAFDADFRDYISKHFSRDVFLSVDTKTFPKTFTECWTNYSMKIHKLTTSSFPHFLTKTVGVPILETPDNINASTQFESCTIPRNVRVLELDSCDFNAKYMKLLPSHLIVKNYKNMEQIDNLMFVDNVTFENRIKFLY